MKQMKVEEKETSGSSTPRERLVQRITLDVWQQKEKKESIVLLSFDDLGDEERSDEWDEEGKAILFPPSLPLVQLSQRDRSGRMHCPRLWHHPLKSLVTG